MRIESVEVHTLVFHYPPDKGFRYAGGTCTGRLTSLVAVHTEEGHTGWGSVYSHPELVRLVIAEQLAPMLQGASVEPVEDAWERMNTLTRWYGRKGAALSALGGVDMALWDLRGQARGLPLYALLAEQTGAAPRRFVPAYASALLWQDELAALTQEAARHVEAGFRRMKMRLGRGERYDVPALEAVQAGAGKDAEVMVDGSMRYSPAEARTLAEALAERKVFWFEEPFAPDALDAFAALQSEAPVPLAAGENEFGLPGFAELVRTGAVDILQPDTCRCGGVTEGQRVFDLAMRHGHRVAPHTWSDAVALLANAHLVGANPNGITVEVDQTGNPFIDELTGGLAIDDGLLALPEAPGLGVAPNPAVIERYRLPPGDPIPDGNYSDMAFGSFVQPPQAHQETG